MFSLGKFDWNFNKIANFYKILNLLKIQKVTKETHHTFFMKCDVLGKLTNQFIPNFYIW